MDKRPGGPEVFTQLGGEEEKQKVEKNWVNSLRKVHFLESAKNFGPQSYVLGLTTTLLSRPSPRDWVVTLGLSERAR